MQIQDPTLTDRATDQKLVERSHAIQQPDDTAEPAWLLFSRLTQDPIVWPRIFPGL